MKSFLDALRTGRFIKLEETDRDEVLRRLARRVADLPGFPAGQDLTGAVLARERESSTALGNGWACPHVRGPGEGPLVCAIGWSPVGLDFKAPDAAPVHLVVFYYIPESAKADYFREISGLAKMIQGNVALRTLQEVKDPETLRSRLLDCAAGSLALAGPDGTAHLIRLEPEPDPRTT